MASAAAAVAHGGRDPSLNLVVTDKAGLVQAVAVVMPSLTAAGNARGGVRQNVVFEHCHNLVFGQLASVCFGQHVSLLSAPVGPLGWGAYPR